MSFFKKKFAISATAFAIAACITPVAMMVPSAFAASTPSAASTTANATAAHSTQKKHVATVQFRSFVIKTSAKIFGIKPGVLIKELHAGQSLAQLAPTHGITAAQLLAQLESSVQTRLLAATQAGKITQVQATSRQASANKRLQTLINKTNWKLPKQAYAGSALRVRHILSVEIAKLLNLTPQQLQTDRKTGESIIQIAQTKNISQATLEQEINTYVMTRFDKKLSTFLQHSTAKPSVASTQTPATGA